jgi:hypothetical protein
MVARRRRVGGSEEMCAFSALPSRATEPPKPPPRPSKRATAAAAAAAQVNWCAALGTVLANEEVIRGLSERGDHPVERLPLRQWSLAITKCVRARAPRSLSFRLPFVLSPKLPLAREEISTNRSIEARSTSAAVFTSGGEGSGF